MPDFTGYPSAILASCEAELMKSGVPEWFIKGFQVSEEEHAIQQWGRCEINAYEWRKFEIKDSEGWRLIDLEPMLSDEQYLALKLAAVAREWLRVFGERSPYEMTLACTFHRLDALWCEREKRIIRARDNGGKSGEARREMVKERDGELVLHALELIAQNTPLRNLTGVLHASKKYKNLTTGDPLTTKSIREILRKHDILKKK